MGEIKFKATRRMHDSGFRFMEKSGDLQFDLSDTSGDVVWLTITKPGTVKIDCERNGTYRLFFDDKIAYVHNPVSAAASPPKKEQL